MLCHDAVDSKQDQSAQLDYSYKKMHDVFLTGSPKRCLSVAQLVARQETDIIVQTERNWTEERGMQRGEEEGKADAKEPCAYIGQSFFS